MNTKAIKLFNFIPVALAVLCVAVQVLFTSAASYGRATLRDMTQNATAVAEVTVLKRTYPEMKGTEFPRTHVEVGVNKTFKGKLPQVLTLDLPGAVHGNNVYLVPDSANFELNERAMVFIKETKAGKFVVQDLGLGKFNLVNRNGQTFVESPLCPKALQAQNDDMEASLLTKSIPYNDFCKLISAYAVNEEPAINPMKLALLMNTKHLCATGQPCEHNALTAMALKNAQAADQSQQMYNFAVAAATLFALAAVIVILRRRNAMKFAGVKSMALIVILVTGSAILTGGFAKAFVTDNMLWNLDATNDPAKVANGKIVWRQSTAVSKTNAAVFADVQGAFDKWASVSNCRLAFQNGGSTSNTTNSPIDNMNVIAWSTSAEFGELTLAVTYTNFAFINGVGYISDADIIFNDRDWIWSNGGTGNVKSVALHEIGHFIGLKHTTSAATVMYPFDGGITTLSADEILAAQTLYPAKGVTPPAVTPVAPVTPVTPVTPVNPVATAPIAAVNGSPLTGPAPLNAFFDASASTDGTNPIAGYAWNFGDGSTGNGKSLSHLFTVAGNYVVTLTVVDTKGLTTKTTITVNVGGTTAAPVTPVTPVAPVTPVTPETPVIPSNDSGSIYKANFKLIFAAPGHDSFTATFYSEKTAGFAAAGKSGKIVGNEGVLSIGGAKLQFTFDPITGKGFGDGAMKISINPKSGLISVTVKTADLQAELAKTGATNENTVKSIILPVNLVFGNGADLAVYTNATFSYTGLQNKAGLGKF